MEDKEGEVLISDWKLRTYNSELGKAADSELGEAVDSELLHLSHFSEQYRMRLP